MQTFPKRPDQENRPLFAFQFTAGMFDDSDKSRILVVGTTREKAPLASVCTETPSELTETAARAALDTESVTTPLMVSLICAERAEANKEKTMHISAKRFFKDFLNVQAMECLSFNIDMAH
jgi:hypothetical protein